MAGREGGDHPLALGTNLPCFCVCGPSVSPPPQTRTRIPEVEARVLQGFPLMEQREGLLRKAISGEGGTRSYDFVQEGPA